MRAYEGVERVRHEGFG